jgi:hypothetical protein
MSDLIKRLREWPLRRGYSEVSIRRTMSDAADEIEKLRAALLLARIAVSHASELSDRILYTQDLARIDAALGEKE